MTAARISDEQLEQFRPVARKAALEVSKDPEVVGEAIDVALMQLRELQDTISPDLKARKAWVRVVARNHGRRVGAKLNREPAFGLGGSLPPPMHDEQLDKLVGGWIADMHLDDRSLGSVVADRETFFASWKLLSKPSRDLLHAKYVEGYSAKQIAVLLDTTQGAVEKRLVRVKAAARELFAEAIEDIWG